MSSSKRSPILSNRCLCPHLSLWFGRATLYSDRVCIQGWTWQGRHRRVVPLERIESVKWWAVTDDVNVLLRLDDGRAIPLQLRRGAGSWNAKLHDLLGQSMLSHHALPDGEPENSVERTPSPE